MDLFHFGFDFLFGFGSSLLDVLIRKEATRIVCPDPGQDKLFRLKNKFGRVSSSFDFRTLVESLLMENNSKLLELYSTQIKSCFDSLLSAYESHEEWEYMKDDKDIKIYKKYSKPIHSIKGISILEGVTPKTIFPLVKGVDRVKEWDPLFV